MIQAPPASVLCSVKQRRTSSQRLQHYITGLTTPLRERERERGRKSEQAGNEIEQGGKRGELGREREREREREKEKESEAVEKKRALRKASWNEGALQRRQRWRYLGRQAGQTAEREREREREREARRGEARRARETGTEGREGGRAREWE